MDENNQNRNVTDELEAAGRKAASAVNSGKNVAKAAAKAGSGNYVGAVVDVLKDENLRNLALVLIACFLVVLLLVLYIFPMSLYEGVQTVINNATDAFWATYYSGEGHQFFKAVWSFLSTTFSQLWNEAKSLINQFSDNTSNPFYEDSDGDIVGGEKNIPGDSVYKKLQAAKEKYRLRKNTIKEAIKNQAYSAVYNQAYAYFQSSYEVGRDVFNGFVWDESGCQKELSDLQALKLMALYAIENDNDFAHIKLTDYIQWLGYNANDGSTMLIDVFGTKVTVPGWVGTYMPQYLVDEAKTLAFKAGEEAGNAAAHGKSAARMMKDYNEAYREKYKEYSQQYGAPIMEMIIKAYVSSTMTSTYQVAYRRMPEYSGDYTMDEYRTNAGLQAEIRKYSDEEEGYVLQTEHTRTTYKYVYHAKNSYNQYYYDQAKQNYYYQMHGEYMPIRWKTAGYTYMPFEIDCIYVNIYQRYKIVTYTAYINVCPRNTETIIEMTGLKQGDITLEKADVWEDEFAEAG